MNGPTSALTALGDNQPAGGCGGDSERGPGGGAAAAGPSEWERWNAARTAGRRSGALSPMAGDPREGGGTAAEPPTERGAGAARFERASDGTGRAITPAC